MKVISSRQEGAHRIDYVTLSPDEERLEACRQLVSARMEARAIYEQTISSEIHNAGDYTEERSNASSRSRSALDWIEALGVETAT